jgi:hypothetical protein
MGYLALPGVPMAGWIILTHADQGRSSWRIGIDVPWDLHFALYVRDAAALARDGDLPGSLSRPPLRVGAVPSQGASEVADAWSRWWTMLLDENKDQAARPQRRAVDVAHFDPPDFDALSAELGLRALCRLVWPAFLDWWAPPERPWWRKEIIDSSPVPIGDLVRAIERQVGRSARPFSLRIHILEAAGRHVIRRSPQYLVMTAETWCDHDVARPVLIESIEELL